LRFSKGSNSFLAFAFLCASGRVLNHLLALNALLEIDDKRILT
jgi:hypothetical protein